MFWFLFRIVSFFFWDGVCYHFRVSLVVFISLNLVLICVMVLFFLRVYFCNSFRIVLFFLVICFCVFFLVVFPFAYDFALRFLFARFAWLRVFGRI